MDSWGLPCVCAICGNSGVRMYLLSAISFASCSAGFRLLCGFFTWHGICDIFTLKFSLIEREKETTMKLEYSETHVVLWASANDTYDWANRPNCCWPCSEIAGHRLRAEFDRNGLVDLTIDGQYDVDVPSDEFNAFVSDVLRDRLPETHKCWFICVEQFVEG